MTGQYNWLLKLLRNSPVRKLTHLGNFTKTIRAAARTHKYIHTDKYRYSTKLSRIFQFDPYTLMCGGRWRRDEVKALTYEHLELTETTRVDSPFGQFGCHDNDKGKKTTAFTSSERERVEMLWGVRWCAWSVRARVCIQ